MDANEIANAMSIEELVSELRSGWYMLADLSIWMMTEGMGL